MIARHVSFRTVKSIPRRACTSFDLPRCIFIQIRICKMLLELCFIETTGFLERLSSNIPQCFCWGNSWSDICGDWAANNAIRRWRQYDPSVPMKIRVAFCRLQSQANEETIDDSDTKPIIRAHEFQENWQHDLPSWKSYGFIIRFRVSFSYVSYGNDGHSYRTIARPKET